jgi:hypothetical protein
MKANTLGQENNFNETRAIQSYELVESTRGALMYPKSLQQLGCVRASGSACMVAVLAPRMLDCSSIPLFAVQEIFALGHSRSWVE